MTIPEWPDRIIEPYDNGLRARCMFRGREANAIVKVSQEFLDEASGGRAMAERELDTALLRLIYQEAV